MTRRACFVMSSLAFLSLFLANTCLTGICYGDGGNPDPLGPNVRVDDATSGIWQTEPAITVAPNGTVYAAWTEWDSRLAIKVARSVNGGASFCGSVKVNDGVPEGGLGVRPAIATDADGNVYVAWSERRNGSYDIYFAKSVNGGISFGSNVKVSDGDPTKAERATASLAVGQDGTVYVAWCDRRNGNSDYNIYFAKSTDGGATFGTNVQVNDSSHPAGPTLPNQDSPSIAVDGSGNIFVIWRDNRNFYATVGYDIYCAKSTNGGSSFGTNARVNNTSFPGIGSTSYPMGGFTSLATSSNGYVYAAWKDYRSGNYDVYFGKSTNGGLSFTNVRVDDTGSSSSWQTNPSIAVAANGAVFISWDDTRNNNSDVYFAKSTNGGSSFSANLRVDDTEPDVAQCWPATAVNGSGNVYVVWQDFRNGNADIYCATDKVLGQITPVVLVHGINGSPADFGELKTLLENEGYFVREFSYSCVTAAGNKHIENCADELGQFLAQYPLSQYPKVDIISHSMGGLVTRAYRCGMASPYQSDGTMHPDGITHYDKIRKLIMIGTPNLGTNRGGIGIALLQLFGGGDDSLFDDLNWANPFIWAVNATDKPTANDFVISGIYDPAAPLAADNDGVVWVQTADIPYNLGNVPVYYVPYPHIKTNIWGAGLSHLGGVAEIRECYNGFGSWTAETHESWLIIKDILKDAEPARTYESLYNKGALVLGGYENGVINSINLVDMEGHAPRVIDQDSDVFQLSDNGWSPGPIWYRSDLDPGIYDIGIMKQGDTPKSTQFSLEIKPRSGTFIAIDFSGPSPIVEADALPFDASVGEEKTVTFRVKNTGLPASGDAYLTISVSDGLDIVQWSNDDVSSKNDDADMQFAKHLAGDQIHGRDGNIITATNTMLDCYEAYDTYEEHLVTVTFKATAAGEQRIKYRATFDDTASGAHYVNYPKPDAGDSIDQQGWEVFAASINVGGGIPTNHRPDKPSNVSPVSQTPPVSLTPELSASAFHDPDTGDTHECSQWAMRSAAGDYNNPVYAIRNYSGDLTRITVPDGALQYNGVYYWHVRYKDNHGTYSEWSDETAIATMPLLVAVTVTTDIGAGTKVKICGTEYDAPKTITAWPLGESRQISVEQYQGAGESSGKQYVFSSWSDGQARTHSVAPTTNTTYTASLRTQWKPTICLNNTDSSYAVDVTHTRDGIRHNDTGIYGTWSDWCDDSSTLVFSQSTTGSPCKFASNIRSWAVNSAVSATINYELPYVPAFILKWGTPGSGDGQFDANYGICSDPQGNIYVADGHNNRIQKFNQQGIFIKKWGTTGSGNGQFHSPIGICSDPEGNIYVVEYNNNRVQKFTQDGIFVTKWGTLGSGDGQFNYPMGGICSDPDGYIYVVDRSNVRVQKFTQDGTFITKWGTLGSGDGQFEFPWGICSDPEGHIYVSEDKRVQKFTQDGTFITKWGTLGSGDGQFRCAVGICSDPQSYIYVVDRDNSRIQKFTQDGIFVTKWGTLGSGDGQFNYPWSICLDPEGNIYVTDMDNNRIQKFGIISAPPMLAADLDAGGQQDIVIDFGDIYGVWIRYNDLTWIKLHDLSPESIVAGSLDSDPKKDLIIDFGDTYGIWIYYNNSTWQQLHSLSPESIVTADLDNNGQDDIIADFGNIYGIWIYYNDLTWIKLHDLSPESIVAGSLDSDPKKDLIIDFGSAYGIWIRYNDSTWTKLHDLSAESIAAADLDNNGQDEIIVDFGSTYGIWIYYNNSTWIKLHDLSPESIVAGSLDSDPKKDLIIDFGSAYGIWIRYNDSTWTKLHDLSPDFIVTGDMNGNGQDDIVVDFGDTYGVWVYYDNGSWSKLHDMSP